MRGPLESAPLKSAADARAAALAFIAAPGDPWPLALALWRWQVENVPAYRAFSRAALGDEAPSRLEEIPAVPVSVFRAARFCAGEPGAIFRTSGTTTGRRGEHAMPDADAYEAGAWAWFRACAPGCPVERTISLTTNPAQAPDSSLGHMVRLFAPGAQWFFDTDRGVDADGAWAALERAASEGAPVFLPATAFALAELFEAAPERSVALPPGSVAMVTGGFKGRRARLDAGALQRAVPRRLGSGVRLLGEYGMTELSSQLWDTGDGFRPPPWLHVYPVDPATGAPADGEGLLRFVDLANWGSCLAIETEDLGEVIDGRVHLRGRLASAPLRGCSLTVEEAQERAARDRDATPAPASTEQIPVSAGDRIAAVRAAIARYGAMDPAAWGTGLSPEGARLALAAAVRLAADAPLDRRLASPDDPTAPRPPRRLVIWCAGNVFTAPLPWVAIFAAMGSEVILKAPSACPAPTMALAEAFAAAGLSARAVALPHARAWGLLEGADAVMGFGSDAAMAELGARIPLEIPRSLHGHRVSFAVVDARPETIEPMARALSLDAALYDGRGCMSPAAVFCLGDAAALTDALGRALARMERRLPRGDVDPGIGPRWRERRALAQIWGADAAGERWAAPLLPARFAVAAPLPRMLPVHPIGALADLAPLADLPLSSCATNLTDAAPLLALGFWRICRPGALQLPPARDRHDGVDVVSALCAHAAIERLPRHPALDDPT